MQRLSGIPPNVRVVRKPRYSCTQMVRDFAILIIATLIFIGAGIASLAGAGAATPAAKNHGDHPETGLFLRRPGGTGLDAPVPEVDASVRIDVSGMIARVKVMQTFKNPDNEWVEGVYIFPLSRKAAVDHMLMHIGERVVEGRIEERKAAQKQYQKAKRSGRKASLVEQERPNLFTASIANIPPNGLITVEISYQEAVSADDGLFSLRFPMVINPRYIPKAPQIAGIGGVGWGVNTATVPDAERITPPMRHPAAGKANPVKLAVSLNPGVPLAMLRSPYHPVQVTEKADGRYDVALRKDAVPADRDFVLEWRAETDESPKATLFAEQRDGETFLLAMVIPPARDAMSDAERLPREVVFVIDTSGSMHGQSIAQAKTALQFAIDQLKPGDRFNIIGFASKPNPLFAKATAVDQQSIWAARDFVKSLAAAGGTEMRRALDIALDDRIDASRLRQIVLLTDGSVGNETELFRAIRRGIGDSRLFTIGIGSAPNAYFMDKAARFGRGSFTFIGKTSEVTEKMSQLFRKLGEPVLTDISVTFPDEETTDSQPDRIPDLYLGEPVVISARVPKAEGDLVIAGRLLGTDWTATLPLAKARPGTGIAKLWAKRKTAALMDDLHEGVDPTMVRRAVLDVALPHQIMSRYTSLVAIDKPVSRPDTEPLTRHAVPTNPPAGWTPPGGAAKPFDRRADAAKGMRQLAQAPNASPAFTAPTGSPSAMIRLHTRTATPARQHLMIAGILIFLAFAVWFLRRRFAR